MSVKITLAMGLAFIAIAVAVIMSASPLTLASTNQASDETELASTQVAASGCQKQESVPSGTSSVRLSLGALIGPTVTVKILSGHRVVASGSRHAGWVGINVSVPITAVRQALTDATLCFAVTSNSGLTVINGEKTPAERALTSGAGEVLPGRMQVEYSRPGGHSWWSMASAITTRIGLGHALEGSWVPLLLAIFMGMAVGLTSWISLRVLR